MQSAEAKEMPFAPACAHIHLGSHVEEATVRKNSMEQAGAMPSLLHGGVQEPPRKGARSWDSHHPNTLQASADAPACCSHGLSGCSFRGS